MSTRWRRSSTRDRSGRSLSAGMVALMLLNMAPLGRL
jgi:hypothetical protein